MGRILLLSYITKHTNSDNTTNGKYEPKKFTPISSTNCPFLIFACSPMDWLWQCNACIMFSN
uniref:Uncharacterized protein n=1 Tax=Piliocolobus tephrosceles TaxID=591936 RepID=A0A8C9HVZ8_9PRIM